MIQRIQTVYLFLAAILVALVAFFPMAHCYVGQGFYTISAFGVSASGVEEFAGSSIWCWCSSACGLAAVVLIVLAIFGYKDRVGQMQRCVFAILALVAYYIFYGVEVWTVYHVTDVMPAFDLVGQCPLIAIILLFLAGRAIKRDEDLVRSMDRIR